MDKEKAASLIEPLGIGDHISGWTLSQIHIEFNQERYDFNTAVYTFSSQATVFVRPREEGINAAATSRNFAISVDSTDSKFNTAAFKQIIALIRQNDSDDYQPLQTLPAIKIPEPIQKLGPIQGWAAAALCTSASALLNPFSTLKAMAKTTKATGNVWSEGRIRAGKTKVL